MQTLHFKPEEIPFHLSSVWKYMRMGSKIDNLKPILELTNLLYKQHIQLTDASVIFSTEKILSAVSDLKQIRLESNVVFEGRGIYKHLYQSDYAVVYCQTVGSRLEEKISLMQKDNFYEAFILDAIASTLLTGLQELFYQKVLKISLDTQKKLTKRFSPGYAGWDLQEQRKIFRLLDPSEIGVILTEDCYMLPGKSVSGVYGLSNGALFI